MLQTDYQVSGRLGTNPEFRPKLLQVTLDSLLKLHFRVALEFKTRDLFYRKPD